MTWSKAQRTCFLVACSAAGWNDQQRYMAMRHAGCPLDSRRRRPSMTHPFNDRRAFVLCMELAERSASAEGRKVRPPRGDGSAGAARTWSEEAARERRGWEIKAKSIIVEASRRLPEVFDDGLLTYAIKHTRGDDARELPINADPRTLAELDAGQLYRVVELLRAYVGRELLARGLTPQSFTAPPSASRRAKPPGVTT